MAARVEWTQDERGRWHGHHHGDLLVWRNPVGQWEVEVWGQTPGGLFEGRLVRMDLVGEFDELTALAAAEDVARRLAEAR